MLFIRVIIFFICIYFCFNPEICGVIFICLLYQVNSSNNNNSSSSIYVVQQGTNVAKVFILFLYIITMSSSYTRVSAKLKNYSFRTRTKVYICVTLEKIKWQ